MLTDSERRRLAEIERGLVEDHRPRRRSRKPRLGLGAVKRQNAATAMLLLVCVAFLLLIGAFTIAIALAAVYALIALGRPPRGPRR